METRTVELPTPDGAMPVYEAAPEDAGRAVVVVQEAFGVNEHIEDVSRRFAEAGYHAVAPHLFHRAGGGTAPYGDFERVLPLFEGLDDRGILVDLEAALTLLQDRGFPMSRTGIVGFCFGGRVTFLAALHHPLGAAAGFYGGGIVSGRLPGLPPLAERSGELQTPWLGLFGDEDRTIPVEDVERLREALGDAPVEAEVVRYPEAGHGFHCDERDDYRPEAAADAWRRTLEWFDRHLDGG